jgi:hypothetical protein
MQVNSPAGTIIRAQNCALPSSSLVVSAAGAASLRRPARKPAPLLDCHTPSLCERRHNFGDLASTSPFRRWNPHGAGVFEQEHSGERAMATTQTKSSSTKSRRTRRTGRRDPLAVTLLKKDHREVEGWFDEYEQLEDEKDKLALFNQIALALKVHTQIEEEILYPEERGEVEDDMLDEAYVEHQSAKTMIAEIEGMKPSDEFYDAKVKVLGEYVKHHVKEEEQPGGIFAQAKKGDEDLDAMGERLKARKEELMAQMGGRRAN